MVGDVESKYKKMYEDDINPFTAFSKKVGTHLAMSNLIDSIIAAYSHFYVYLVMQYVSFVAWDPSVSFTNVNDLNLRSWH